MIDYLSDQGRRLLANCSVNQSVRLLIHSISETNQKPADYVLIN